jgi:hypothetical protein
MLGMSFREFIELYHGLHFEATNLEEILKNHESLSRSVTIKIEEAGQKIIPIFKEYLKVGHYPYFFDLKNEELFFITLEQNIHSTVENDLLFVYPSISGNSIKKILALLGVIRQSVPFTPDMSKLKKLIDVGDERTLKNYLKYLEDAGLIRLLAKSSNTMSAIEKPEKIYLDNSNLLYIDDANIGNVRETFFLSMLSSKHNLSAASTGDFLVDKKYIFEIGGKNKGFEQIKDIDNSYLALDDIEQGIGNKIPLWMFGFLY